MLAGQTDRRVGLSRSNNVARDVRRVKLETGKESKVVGKAERLANLVICTAGLVFWLLCRREKGTRERNRKGCLSNWPSPRPQSYLQQGKEG